MEQAIAVRTSWQVWPYGDREGFAVVTGADGEQEICGEIEREDVARVVAAAPELLAALRIAERELSWAVQQQCAGSSWANQDGATALDNVRKAITLAGC